MSGNNLDYQKQIQLASRIRRQVYKKHRQLKLSRENAAIVAGYPKKVAQRRAAPPQPDDFKSLFEQQLMTNNKKVAECIEGMNAMKVTYDKLGVEHENPDWTARHKYFTTMLVLCKQLDTSKNGGDTNVLIIGSLAERIKEARETNAQDIKVRGACIEKGRVVVDADYEVEEEVEKGMPKSRITEDMVSDDVTIMRNKVEA